MYQVKAFGPLSIKRHSEKNWLNFGPLANNFEFVCLKMTFSSRFTYLVIYQTYAIWFARHEVLTVSE